MKNFCTKIFFLLICFNAQAQNKSFIRSIDSNSSVEANRYLKNQDYSWLKDDLEPFNIDQEALNAAVFHSVNQTRKKLRKESCEYDYKLDVIAYQHVLNLKYYKFRNTMVNQNKMNRYMYWASRRIGVKDGFVVAIVDVPYLMDFKKGSDFFYDQKDQETDMHLFYGNKSQLRDSNFVKEPVLLYNYETFGNAVAKELMKGRSGRKLRAASYTKLACWIMPIEKTIAGKRIPQAKMIIVFSGKRMHEIAMKGI